MPAATISHDARRAKFVQRMAYFRKNNERRELIDVKKLRSVRACGVCREADPAQRVWATACDHAVCRDCANGKDVCPLCEKPTTFMRLFEEKSCGICSCEAPYNWGAFTGCGHTVCGACCLQLYLCKGSCMVCPFCRVESIPLQIKDL